MMQRFVVAVSEDLCLFVYPVENVWWNIFYNEEETPALLPEALRSFLKTSGTDESRNSSVEPKTSLEIEAQGRLASWFSQADTDPLTFKASLCLCLAMLFLPVIATPFGMRKYVLLHTLGSILLIGSFSFLWGPWNYVKSLFATERLPFIVSYLLSLCGGLYFVIVWHSAVFAALALVFQICLIVWQIITTVPGGRTGLSALLQVVCGQ
ncbi:unnamed protein product [Heterobilharzia americana]|nr:unnamed protein product [Heterobilharzia americana]